MENNDQAAQPKIIKTKTYTIKIVFFDNDTCKINRTCDGFNAFELLGICAHASLDIMDQIGGRVRPTEVKRSLIVDQDPSPTTKNPKTPGGIEGRG